MDQIPQQDLAALQLAHQRVESTAAQAQLSKALLDNLMLKIYLKYGIPVDASLDSATGKITLSPKPKDSGELDLDQV